MDKNFETVIGISFGNANSFISFQKDNKVEVIANLDGDRAIPSMISYTGSDELHGAQAKAQLIRNSKNTVTNFRDFIGKKLAEIDPTFNRRSACPVEKDGNISFSLKINNTNETETISNDNIVKRHLSRLKDAASDYIGKKIDGAVITVPTDWTETQREALVEIAGKADLAIMQVINEPTAELLAHVAARLSNKTGTLDKVFAVIDVGGTRTDGAIITYRGGIFTVIATQHDYELGGYRLDEAIAKYVSNQFQKKFKINPLDEPRSVAKLLVESESVKKTLSNTSSATFAVESLTNGIDFHLPINRLRFETFNKLVFDSIDSFVQTLLKRAGLEALDIDEVLIAGGSAFVPKIASTVAAIFDKSTPVIAPSLDTKAINPDELAVRGAALQASLISMYSQEEIKESLQPIVTTVPHTVKPIGVIVQALVTKHDENDTAFVPIIEPNTSLPFRKSHIFKAHSKSVLISLFEAESCIETAVENEPKKEKCKDSWDDESDNEPEKVRFKVYKPTTKLAEAALNGLVIDSDVEVIVNITSNLVLELYARQVAHGSTSVRGELPAATNS